MPNPNSQTAVRKLQDAPELSREEIVARLIALAQHKSPYALSPVENAMWRQACWQGAALLSQSAGPADDAVLEELQSVSDDLHTHGHGLAAARVERRIHLLKNAAPQVALEGNRNTTGLPAPARASSEAGKERGPLRYALEKIAELEGDTENQKFKLTRFQAAQIARAALSATSCLGAPHK